MTIKIDYDSILEDHSSKDYIELSRKIQSYVSKIGYLLIF